MFTCGPDRPRIGIPIALEEMVTSNEIESNHFFHFPFERKNTEHSANHYLAILCSNKLVNLYIGGLGIIQLGGKTRNSDGYKIKDKIHHSVSPIKKSQLRI
jgi:hypothetical protein